MKYPSIMILQLLICNTSAVTPVNNENSVKITYVSIPKYAVAGTDVKFVCNFTIIGHSHELYSVSWWRGKHQFFSYKGIDPKPSPYNLNGITVSMAESSKEVVVLKNVKENTTGEYKCEIMGEGPNFKTDIKKGFLTIIVPPKNITIENIGNPMQNNYNLTDIISMKCTVIGMKPPPQIYWLINGKNVIDPIRRNNEKLVTVPDKHRMPTVLSTIEFQPQHVFEREVANVSCMASVHGQNFTSPATKINLDPTVAFKLYSSSERNYLSCVGAMLLLLINVNFLLAIMKTVAERYFC